MTIRDHIRRILDGPRPAPIVFAGHGVLRGCAVPYDGQIDEAELAELIELMHETMRSAPGVGLAAPQIGISLALAVIEDPGISEVDEIATVRDRFPFAARALINPEYEAVHFAKVSFYEGCLSIPGYQAVRARYRSVTLRHVDLDGRSQVEVLSGWPARIVQHEIDHLRGELYLDRAELRSLCLGEAPWASEPTPKAAAQVLGFSLAQDIES